MKRTILFLSFLLVATCCCSGVFAQQRRLHTDGPRVAYDLSVHWAFIKDPKDTGKMPGTFAGWTDVKIPHTWNAYDVMDDKPGYYRGAGWYKLDLAMQRDWKDKHLFLCFDGANQEAEVYVNGKKAGTHIGGYSRFVIPISSYLKFNKGKSINQIAVKINNRFNESIAPLTADFTFFGGMYRSVQLLVADPVHFDGTKYGADGVYISTPKVSAKEAEISVKGTIKNETKLSKLITIVTQVYSPSGEKLNTTSTKAVIPVGDLFSFNQELPKLADPELWSPDKPALYRVITQIADGETGVVIDQLTNRIGLRWFRFDANEGFFLNGKHLKLMGASRHQDYAGMGNAVPASLQIRDLELLKSFGGNFLRVAHYPQDPAILAACDRLGILASVEIPVVNEITETEAFYQNCKTMQEEMIWQNYNHPSIIVWGYMNEVLLKMHFKDDKPRQDQYITHVAELARALESLTRAADPSRYTMIANHGDFNLYTRAGLTKIPMLLGWNLYQGWYGGTLADFGKNLDNMHKQQPDKPFIVSEYGADADPRIHSFKTERFDKSVEYAVEYHQVYLNDILKRPFVAGGAAWNLSDFNSESRAESMPHINNKGLLTLDRRPKNTYYLYQATLLDRPYVQIGLDGQELVGTASKGDENGSQQIQVFSNLPELELFLNAVSQGKKTVTDHMASWNVPFVDGANRLGVVGIANGQKVGDTTTVHVKLQPYELSSSVLPFREIAISSGDPRYVRDNKRVVWFPDQPYRSGSYGFVGGTPFKMKDSNRQKFGTDKDILGTYNDPIYQTQDVGLESYKLDVPDGSYLLTLHFAELLGEASNSSLPYNLDANVRKEVKESRVFDVFMNGEPLLKNVDLSKKPGNARPLVKDFKLKVKKGAGIELTFKAITGSPVLNGIQLKKIN
ncbi:glycoside hydrolase family 2 TIM barrel-domain containing protein [Pedobacter duraquae]|uniref:Beta-galactosidase n=1 Tax=Pedobacter duraquae TaxID=425511 RepID=A0A4R6IKY9_9SPHI|nr:glycoside hydrolase family 2 TIM barrel-domain containing protein [Pedobacter duraquae]TDO22769.1 beta-galactosidase [Pedobacter duraquae]